METPTLEAVLAKVLAVGAELLNVPLTATTSFVDEQLLDSLNLVNLVAGLDQAFGIATPNTELRGEYFETPTTVAELYLRQLSTPGV